MQSKTRFISNNTAQAIFVGGKMIPPGDGRDIDVTLLPPEGEGSDPPPEEAPPDPNANLLDLLKGNVAAVSAALPDSSDETLAKLAELEQAGAARKGVLSAVAADQLRRAQLKAGTPE